MPAPLIARLPAVLMVAAVSLALVVAAAPARALDTAAKEALAIDAETGATLLDKNADIAAPPASMLKLMTLNMVFEALREGRLSLDDRFQVSEKAWRMEGSRMFLREGERVRVEDLIRGVIIQSGNDACVVLAEGLAGSEEAFAEAMNRRAKELGMTASSFGNSTGLPDPRGRMSPRDLVFLAKRIIDEFPDLYPIFSETEFEWGGVKQKNRDPLLYADIGADGLKTGHTAEAGYGLVGSAVQKGRRVIFMVGGLESKRQRALEGERIVKWAFREFSNETLYTAGQPLGEAEVWIGAADEVGLTVAKDARVTVPFGALKKAEARISYEGPLEAPIAAGQEVAELTVTAPGMDPVVIPLVAAEAVERGGYLKRVGAAATLLLRDVVGDTASLPGALPGFIGGGN